MEEDKKQKKENTNSELEELKQKCEEYLNGWKRERADFLNYKKEEMEKISQLAKYANEELILNFLPILDNICLAESHILEELREMDPAKSSDDDRGATWLQGISQIKKQFLDLLKKEGIEPVKTIGEKFDPNTMEAVGEAESTTSDVALSGAVVEEVQRGYTLNGKIIRVAKVRVTK